MKTFLLDPNLLIALLWPGHSRPETARTKLSRQRKKGWGTGPLTPASFGRIVSNPSFSRDTVQVPAANLGAKDHCFWVDDLPIAEAVDFAGSRLVGHQQGTVACLAELALRPDGEAGHAGPRSSRPRGTRLGSRPSHSPRQAAR